VEGRRELDQPTDGRRRAVMCLTRSVLWTRRGDAPVVAMPIAVFEGHGMRERETWRTSDDTRCHQIVGKSDT
jgi:hypothetical protein